MRRWLLALLLTLTCAAIDAHAAITLANSNKAQAQNGSSGTSRAVTFPNAQTGGNTNLLSVSFCADVGCGSSASGITPSISDTTGNSYSAVLTNTDNANTKVITYCASNIGAGSNTVTVSTGATTVYYMTAFVSEWSGMAASCPVDVSGHTSGSSAAPSVSTSSATTDPNDLTYGYISSAQVPTTGSGLTLLSSDGGGDADEYRVETTTGTKSASWTQSSGTFTASVVTFKPASVGTTCAPTLGLLGVSSCG